MTETAVNRTPAEEPENPQDTPEEQTPVSEELVDTSWLQSILRPALIAIMAGCLVLAMLAFARRLIPMLPGVYTQLLVTLGILASVLGSITTTWLAQPGQRSQRSVGYRTAELLLILTAVRVSVWVTTSWPGFEQFLVEPLTSLLDGYFIVGAAIVLIAWVMSTAMTDDLLALALQPDDLYAVRSYATDRWQDSARPLHTDRTLILRRFVGRWVAGGLLLVVLAAGSRYDLPESGFLGVIRQNIDPTVVAAIIIYFLSGLVLISQGQLALLRARWTLQRTPAAEGILRNWPFYAFLLLVAVGFLAALMPLGDTFYLAQILTAVLSAIYSVLFGFVRFVLGAFLLMLSWLTGDTTQETPPPTQEPMATIQPTSTPESNMEMPPWTGGVIFWGVALILMGYAAYIYFSGKATGWGWLRRLWAMLRSRWQLIFGAYQDWQAARIRQRDAARADKAEGDNGGLLPRWLRFRTMDPDQQVRYYYLSILQRAERAGIPRDRSETPTRYAPRLAQRLEASEEDSQAIDELTAEFVRVRYGGRHVESGQLARVKTFWQQIKRLLRL